MVKLSRGHPDDPTSYHPLPVSGHGYDPRTGTFECGDPTKSIEEAEVQLPYDSSCDECTLQWVYEAPNYGSLFQCADISIIAGKKDVGCGGECQNGGVCQNNLCYCSAGFFGEYCQHHGKANQFYEPVSAQGKPKSQPDKPMQFEEKSSGGLGVFGWYFLLMLLALVIAGILAAIVFLTCGKKIKEMVHRKDKDLAGKGRGGDKGVRPGQTTLSDDSQSPTNKRDSDHKKADDKNRNNASRDSKNKNKHGKYN